MELAIPAGAVPEGTENTATPLRALQGSPFAATPDGLKLEPSWQVLLQPATLTLPRPSRPGQLVAFRFNGAGERFHLVPASASCVCVQLQDWLFGCLGAL